MVSLKLGHGSIQTEVISVDFSTIVIDFSIRLRRRTGRYEVNSLIILISVV